MGTRRLASQDSQPGCLCAKANFCCLIGLGRVVIKEMVKSTGAGIEILDETDVPACASNCERVLQITRELVDVRNALLVVSGIMLSLLRAPSTMMIMLHLQISLNQLQADRPKFLQLATIKLKISQGLIMDPL